MSKLAQYTNSFRQADDQPGFQIITHKITAHLQAAIELLNGVQSTKPPADLPDPLSQHLQSLLQERQAEIKAGLMETTAQKKLAAIKPVADQFHTLLSLSKDIYKTSKDIPAL